MGYFSHSNLTCDYYCIDRK